MVWTLLRFYFTFRLIAMHSEWSNNEVEHIWEQAHVFYGTKFILKCMLKQRPYSILFGTILISTIILSYWLRVAEIPFMHISEQNWGSEWNAIWVCAMVSSLLLHFFNSRWHLSRWQQSVTVTSTQWLALADSSASLLPYGESSLYRFWQQRSWFPRSSRASRRSCTSRSDGAGSPKSYKLLLSAILLLFWGSDGLSISWITTQQIF